MGLVCVLWVEPLFRNKSYDRFQQLMQYAMADLNECAEVGLATTLEEAEELTKDNKLFIILGIEGLAFMEYWRGTNNEAKLENALNDLSPFKISHAIFAWNETNFLASGTGGEDNSRSGLTSAGELAVSEMNRRHWHVDVSHLDEISFWDIANISEKPLLASHSNAKRLCPHERNLTDEQIKAIAATGGLIGINSNGPFINESCPSITHFVDHIAYVANLVGIKHVGLGFDFLDYLQDYQLEGAGFKPTKGLEGAAQIPDLVDHMITRGFSYEDIDRVCFENAFKYLFRNRTIDQIKRS
jgi:membrane dipeptidase